MRVSAKWKLALRDERLYCKVLHDIKILGTTDLRYRWKNVSNNFHFSVYRAKLF